MGLGERAQHLADVGAVGGDLALAADGRAQDGGDANRGHGERGPYTGGGAERLVVREDAHLVVGDLVGLARADRALGVAADLQLGRRRGQRVVHQQAADERVARADDELDDLGRLQQAHRARQDAEDAVGAARGRQLGRRRLAEEAAVARALVGAKTLSWPSKPRIAALTTGIFRRTEASLSR